MSKKITFSAFGRDSYYHRDWFKKNGFKFDRSSRKWTVNELPIEHAEEFATWDLFFESGTIQRFIRSGDVQKSISLNQNPTEQFLYILNKYLNTKVKNSDDNSMGFLL